MCVYVGDRDEKRLTRLSSTIESFRQQSSVCESETGRGEYICVYIYARSCMCMLVCYIFLRERKRDREREREREFGGDGERLRYVVRCRMSAGSFLMKRDIGSRGAEVVPLSPGMQQYNINVCVI